MKSRRMSWGWAGRGFTLIELLVVVAIIALLVSILMPSLKRAKDQAKVAVCMSNQDALLNGMMMYLDDYYEIKPPGSMSPNTTGHKSCSWPDGYYWGISCLYPYVENFRAYQCPADIATAISPMIFCRMNEPSCEAQLSFVVTPGRDPYFEQVGSVGYSYQWNDWGMGEKDQQVNPLASGFKTATNRYMAASKINSDVVWLYENSGGNFNTYMIVNNYNKTDIYAKEKNLPVQGEDVPYNLPPVNCFFSKRHAGSHVVARLNGKVEKFEWGKTKVEDWAHR